MPRLVMKFGGTSVADLDRIRGAAAKVRREVERGYDVAVVVSAMAGKTNELVGWVRETSLLYDAREYDAVVASGENVTAGLMALTLQEMGVPARSWQGWQVPVRTNIEPRRRPHRGDRDRQPRPQVRRRPARRHRRLPGPRPRRADHHARPRRLGHHRGRLRRGARGRALRHLHRRRRRLHHRPADHRARRASSRRSPTRRCSSWRASAPRCCRRARSSSRCATRCGSRCSRPFRTFPALWSATRRRSWNRVWSAALPSRATRRR